MHMAERGTGEPWPLYLKILLLSAVLLSYFVIIYEVFFEKSYKNFEKYKISYERNIQITNND